MNIKTNTKRISTLVTGAVLLALSSVSVQADPMAKKQAPSKEQKIGMASGVVAGALLGGPIGAGLGFIIGTVSGAHVGQVRATAQKAISLEGQLAVTQKELQSAQTALAAVAVKSGDDPMLVQLAQRLRADVLFRTASAELDPTSSSKLADLAGVLASYPGLVIEIDGYADPRGKADDNYELSQQRALAVRAALMVGGAQSDSIRITAHGEKLSTAAKGDMDAYALERRVSLSVVSANQGQVAQAQ